MSVWLGPVIAISLLASPEVRLELEPGLRCELGRTIAGALTEQQVKLVESGAPSWVLAVQRDGDAVSLRMTNPQGAVRGVRRLNPTSADCAALPRSVALLVKSWLAMQLDAPTEVVEVEPAPPAFASVPPPVHPERSRGTRTATAPTTARTTAPEPLDSARDERGETPRPAPVLVAAADPPPPIPAPELTAPSAPDFFVTQPGPRAPRAPSTRSFSAMAAGGGAIGISDPVVGMGMFTLEWGFSEPWAVSLDAGLESERRGERGGGVGLVSLRWATLSVRRAFFADGLRGLHVSLGIQAVHLVASAAGFSNARGYQLVDPGAAANVEWRQPIASGLFLFARLNVQARLPQNFTVTENGSTFALVTVAPWGFGLQGGVGWNFL